MNSLRACANTDGSFSATHAIFGPAAWVESAEPPRDRISSAPSSLVSRAICAVALLASLLLPVMAVDLPPARAPLVNRAAARVLASGDEV